METPILAKVIRGATVESVHRGHLIVIESGGNVLFSVGDPRTVTYFRSSSKPFQAMPLVTSGAADAFGFTEDEIALGCASHSGERIHVEIAGRMLEKAGLSEADLRCGIHLPFYEKEAERLLRAGEKVTQLHNNCSGKHAAMLAFARHIGAPLEDYEDLENPVQRSILQAVSEFCEIPVREISVGVDGCCAPNFAMPIESMARGFLNLVAPGSDLADLQTRDAAKRIVSAMLAHPELIGGTDRFDTLLMRAAAGKLISKVGAEGVWLCGILPSAQFPKGAAIALKIEDGNDYRARPVVVVEILRRLGVLSAEDLPELSPMPIKNRRGETVGRVEAILDN